MTTPTDGPRRDRLADAERLAVFAVDDFFDDHLADIKLCTDVERDNLIIRATLAYLAGNDLIEFAPDDRWRDSLSTRIPDAYRDELDRMVRDAAARSAAIRQSVRSTPEAPTFPVGARLVHRQQCAANTRGCQSTLAWEDSTRWGTISDIGLRALHLNGWRLDGGEWICGHHAAAPVTPIFEDVRRILNRHPNLSSNGWAPFPTWSASDLAAGREELLLDSGLDEIRRAMTYLSRCRRVERQSKNCRTSYELKYLAEQEIGYVSNGAMIVAALLSGVEVRPNDGPNPYLLAIPPAQPSGRTGSGRD